MRSFKLIFMFDSHHLNTYIDIYCDHENYYKLWTLCSEMNPKKTHIDLSLWINWLWLAEEENPIPVDWSDVLLRVPNENDEDETWKFSNLKMMRTTKRALLITLPINKADSETPPSGYGSKLSRNRRLMSRVLSWVTFVSELDRSFTDHFLIRCLNSEQFPIFDIFAFMPCSSFHKFLSIMINWLGP